MKLIKLLTFSCAIAAMAPAAEVKTVAPSDAAKLIAEGKAILVDCREPAEWKESGVAAPAHLLPKSDFDGEQQKWKEFLAKNPGKQILIYCRAGGRAKTIAGALEQKGVSAASVGGLKDWTQAGLPTRAADAPPVATKAEGKK